MLKLNIKIIYALENPNDLLMESVSKLRETSGDDEEWMTSIMLYVTLLLAANSKGIVKTRSKNEIPDFFEDHEDLVRSLSENLKAKAMMN